MELTTEVPQTGTKLRIDADRAFEQSGGDTVLRVQGQGTDGGQVFDSAFVELSEQEANAVAKILEWVLQPAPEIQDMIAQEVQATFSSKLSGRDAQQIAHIVQIAQWQAMQQKLGLPSPEQVGDQGQHPLRRLAERFQRAAAKKRAAYSGGNGERQQQRSGR